MRRDLNMKDQYSYFRPRLFIRRFFILLSVVFMIHFFLPAASVWSRDNSDKKGADLTATLDRKSAPVGGIVTLTLQFSPPKGSHIKSPPEIRGLNDLNVVDQKTGPGLIKIMLLVDKLGTWRTGPLELIFRNKDGTTKTLKADTLSLEVMSNLGDKPEQARLKPIRKIIPIGSRWPVYLPWAGGSIVALLIIFFLIRWLKNRGKRAGIIYGDPPHVLAKKEIEDLEASGLFQKGDIKGFYFRLTGIMRRYLEAIREFPAAEFTTEEIAASIHKKEDLDLLSLLRDSDKIKFADTIPSPARKEEGVKTALSYIEKTMPAPGEDSSDKAAAGGAE